MPVTQTPGLQHSRRTKTSNTPCIYHLQGRFRLLQHTQTNMRMSTRTIYNIHNSSTFSHSCTRTGWFESFLHSFPPPQDSTQIFRLNVGSGGEKAKHIQHTQSMHSAINCFLHIKNSWHSTVHPGHTNVHVSTMLCRKVACEKNNIAEDMSILLVELSVCCLCKQF